MADTTDIESDIATSIDNAIAIEADIATAIATEVDIVGEIVVVAIVEPRVRFPAGVYQEYVWCMSALVQV